MLITIFVYQVLTFQVRYYLSKEQIKHSVTA